MGLRITARIPGIDVFRDAQPSPGTPARGTPTWPWDVHGNIRQLDGTPPAAGANFIFEPSSIAPHSVWWLITAGCTLTTDANAAARVVSLALEPPGGGPGGAGLPTRWASWGSGRSVPANEVMEFFWGRGTHKDDLGATIEHHQQGSILDGPFLTDLNRLIIFVGERQAGDTLTNITLSTEEWALP